MKQKKIPIDKPIGVSLESISETQLFAGQSVFAERLYDENSEYPTTEQVMLRQAVKYLTPKQRKVWDLYNYDKFTQDEIGVKLGITHQGVAKHIKAIEKRLAKWCKSHMETYKLLKHEMEGD